MYSLYCWLTVYSNRTTKTNPQVKSVCQLKRYVILVRWSLSTCAENRAYLIEPFPIESLPSTWMPPRCRVTFFNNAHGRTLEIDAALPFAGAEIALAKLVENNVSVEDLHPEIQIEVVTTVAHTLPVRAVTKVA
jgi:hypothetical protein